MTDQTPLGTPRERVAAWHLANDWCQTRFPHPDVLTFRPCTAPDRHRISVMLTFSSEDELETAIVTVAVPPPHAAHGGYDGPGAYARHRDLAIDLMDALASELAARYGRPHASTWTERRWTTRDENIRVSWVELADDMFVVREEHHGVGPGAGLASSR